LRAQTVKEGVVEKGGRVKSPVRRGGDRVKEGGKTGQRGRRPSPTDPGDLPVTRLGKSGEVKWAFDGPGVKGGGGVKRVGV
jgi:hypothetical protein